MVKKNRTKAKLKAGSAAYGVTVGPGELTLVELGGALGFDYVMIDWEHYLFNARDVEDVIRVADIYGMTSLVRMQLNPEHIAHVLSAGAQGVLVARVNSAADVRTILDAAKFHPEGKRTIFFNGRATNYRLDLAGASEREFSRDLNRETLIGCIIEEISGVEKLAEIMAFPEIDMIHLGPADLAHSMAWPAKEKVDAASEQIIATAVKAGKAMSTTWGARKGTSEASDMTDALAKGYRMFVVSPRAYFRAGGAEFLRYAKQAAKTHGLPILPPNK
jgi:staphyloferrin B biosynthesis citrate synthase